MAEQSRSLKSQGGAFACDRRSAKDKIFVNVAHCGQLKDELCKKDQLLENTLNDIPAANPLTKRELEVLRFIVSGKTNKEIAKKLCRTERTVEYHRNRLMRKLDAHNAADLVKRAITLGIIS
jgi:DNA-binding NarL/FixJ family response regulator